MLERNGGVNRGGRRLLRFTFAISLLAAIILGFPASVRAADPVRTFRVEPVKLEITAAPGETATRTIRVTNHGNVPLDATVSISDYLVRPDSSFVFSAPGHESYSCASWITLPRAAAPLLPGEGREYPITIRIPSGAEPGGHYACVLFTATQGAPTGSGVGISVGIGTLALVTVTSGPIRRSGEISDFSVPNALLSRNVDARVLFQNTGNVHVSVLQEVVFTDVFGRVVGRVSNKEPATILPGTQRYMSERWVGPHLGWFNARAVLRYGPDIVTYDRQLASESIGFLIVSPESLGILLGAALATAGVLSIVARARRGRLAAAAVKERSDATSAGARDALD
jgi:hypothetical protein